MLKLLRRDHLSLLLRLVMGSSWCSGWPGCTRVLLIGYLISLIIDQIFSRFDVIMGHAGISEQLPRKEEGCRKIHRN